MEKEGKKYLIRESELKEILREIVLTELYDPNDYKDMYTKNFDGNVPNVGDAFNGVLNLIKGIPGLVIPDSMREKIAAGDSDVLQWLMGALGTTAAGTAGPDKWPNIGQKPGTGQNGDAHEQLNVAAACNWLSTYANKRSIKRCAKYVRMALNRGGLSLPSGMSAPSAKFYYNVLPANGWDFISPQQAGEPCDVVVIDETESVDRRHYYKDGHIAMCIGNGVWASDFIQSSPLGLRYPVPVEKVHYFRYRNRV